MQKKYYLSACCILKDEDPFIIEWLVYHSLIGVEHFFIYDNESANPLSKNPLVQKFALQGKITLMDVPGKTMQIPAYMHCLQKYGPMTKWLAYLDLDEFICPAEGTDIRPLLAGYEDYAALGLSWKCFSSGGHLSSPTGLVIKNYQERFLKEVERNLHIKSIIQPEKNHGVHTPHSFWPNEGEIAASAAYRPITHGNAMIPICWEKATVHHYILKSQEDAQRRIRRGRADIESDRPTVDNDDFYRMAHEPVEMDDSMERFVPEVEQWIKAGELPETHSESLKNIEHEKLVEMANIMLRDGNLEDAAITLCHAATSRWENPALWQARAKLAALKQQDELANIFAQKAARAQNGLAVSLLPANLAKKKFNEKRAETLLREVKNLVLNSRHNEAENFLARLDANFQLTSNMLIVRAQLAMERNETSKAEEYLELALGMEEQLLVYQVLVQLRMVQGNFKDARDLVFYLIHTGTYRVVEQDFYDNLTSLFNKLKQVTQA